MEQETVDTSIVKQLAKLHPAFGLLAGLTVLVGGSYEVSYRMQVERHDERLNSLSDEVTRLQSEINELRRWQRDYPHQHYRHIQNLARTDATSWPPEFHGRPVSGSRQAVRSIEARLHWYLLKLLDSLQSSSPVTQLRSHASFQTLPISIGRFLFSSVSTEMCLDCLEHIVSHIVHINV